MRVILKTVLALSSFIMAVNGQDFEAQKSTSMYHVHHVRQLAEVRHYGL